MKKRCPLCAIDALVKDATGITPNRIARGRCAVVDRSTLCQRHATMWRDAPDDATPLIRRQGL